MTNNIYIYHHDDVDGISAAAMICLAYPNATKKCISSTYPFSIDDTQFQFITNPEDITVFVVDLSLNQDALSKLLTGDMVNRVNQVIWIDHHETSVVSVKKNTVPFPKKFYKYIDQKHCGAMLTYDYLHPNTECPEFLKVIDTYDRHDGSPMGIKLATDFNLSLLSIANLSPQSDVWGELMRGGDVSLQTCIGMGGIIHDYLDTENKKTIQSRAVITKVCDIECIAVNAPGTSILFASVPLDKYPLRLAWYYTGSDYKYTLYSDGNINCANIAARFGGGGHPGAAGFRSDQLLFLDQHCEKYPSD